MICLKSVHGYDWENGFDRVYNEDICYVYIAMVIFLIFDLCKMVNDDFRNMIRIMLGFL